MCAFSFLLLPFSLSFALPPFLFYFFFFLSVPLIPSSREWTRCTMHHVYHCNIRKYCLSWKKEDITLKKEGHQKSKDEFLIPASFFFLPLLTFFFNYFPLRLLLLWRKKEGKEWGEKLSRNGNRERNGEEEEMNPFEIQRDKKKKERTERR